MAKDYKNASPAEKDASARKMDSESWNPVDAAMKFVASKTGADKPVPPAPPQGIVNKKAGGTIHNVDYVKSTAGGTHHSEYYKEHAAGHTANHEIVKEFGKK